MNSFYVPALAGQIYAMPGMETKLHGVFDKTGEYEGFSANYSGWGFSNMRFAVKSLPPGEFDKWVAAAKASAEGNLSRNANHELQTPNHTKHARPFSAHDTQFFDAGDTMFSQHGQAC